MGYDLEEIKKQYRLKFDHHTHTVYSRVGFYLHGKGRIIDNARAAAKRGLDSLAITDHGPSDFYGLDPRKIPEMRRKIAEAKMLFPKLKIYLGVEADIVDTENGLEGGGTAGYLGYFAPWNNVVMYYGDFEEYPGLYILGEAVSGAENIKDIKGTITMEPAGE